MSKTRVRIKTAAPPDPRLENVVGAQRSLFPHYSNATLPAAHSDFTGVVIFNVTQERLMICLGASWRIIRTNLDPY